MPKDDFARLELRWKFPKETQCAIQALSANFLQRYLIPIGLIVPDWQNLSKQEIRFLSHIQLLKLSVWL
jgi:hypothetical protein